MSERAPSHKLDASQVTTARRSALLSIRPSLVAAFPDIHSVLMAKHAPQSTIALFRMEDVLSCVSMLAQRSVHVHATHHIRSILTAKHAMQSITVLSLMADACRVAHTPALELACVLVSPTILSILMTNRVLL